MDIHSLTVQQNTTQKRFEIALGNEDYAFINYVQEGDAYLLVHTEVPTAYEGQGVAEKLVQDSLMLIRTQGKQMVPLCPYVKAYIKRHPNYEDITIHIP